MPFLPMLLYHEFLEPRSRICPIQKDNSSIVKSDKNIFKVSLDVQQFTPNELTVTSCNDMIKVEGKHEEKPDEHGYISRHFIRKYKLPKGHDVENIKTTLSSDGVLTIFSRKRKHENDEREITIILTGPSKVPITNGIENHKDEGEEVEEPKEKRTKQ